jgi:predicted transcriptional regulator
MRSFEEINRLRAIHGFSRRKVYRRAEVDQETWRRTELGRTQPNIATLRRLDEALEALIAEKESASCG